MFRRIIKCGVVSALVAAIVAAPMSVKDVSAKMLYESTFENPYTVAALGDSITYPYSYASVIDGCPNVTVSNFGVPGSQVAGPDATSYLNRCKGIKGNPDLILVMGGTNDYCAFATLAKDIGALDSTDTNTFCGAYNKMIKTLRANNPRSRIILMTPTMGRAVDYKNIYGYTLKNYADATKLIAVYNGLHCIDLYNNENCNFADPKNSDLLVDPIHPSTKGHEIIAKEVINNIAAIEFSELDGLNP